MSTTLEALNIQGVKTCTDILVRYFFMYTFTYLYSYKYSIHFYVKYKIMLYLYNHNHVNIKIVYCQPAKLPMTLYYPSSKIVTEIIPKWQLFFFFLNVWEILFFVVSKMWFIVFSHLVCSNILDTKAIISLCKHAPPYLANMHPCQCDHLKHLQRCSCFRKEGYDNFKQIYLQHCLINYVV